MCIYSSLWCWCYRSSTFTEDQGINISITSYIINSEDSECVLTLQAGHFIPESAEYFEERTGPFSYTAMLHLDVDASIENTWIKTIASVFGEMLFHATMHLASNK